MASARNLNIEPLPGSDALGYSYDVFGFFANPRSVMKQLFVLGAQRQIYLEDKTWLLSSEIDCIAIRDTEMETISLRTTDAYSEQLAVSVKVSGSYGLFSASVQSDFSQGFSDQTDSTYTSVRTNVNKWKLSLKPTTEVLRSLLIPTFKKALATMDAKDLFDAYGTYYLSEVLVGGRADYVATTKTSAFSSNVKISAVAKASYKSLTDASASTEMAQEVKTFRSNSSSRLYAVGGSALSSITDPYTYKSWLTSVDTLPVFCGFTYASLRPLWELAESDQRRQALRKATDKYVPLRIRRNAIVELEVILSDSYWESPPYGFTKIDYDLNRNAKGKYIFFCYKQVKLTVAGSPADPKPVTALHVAYANEPSQIYVPPGFIKIDKDLNAGAGGKYIYLCYSKDADKAEKGLPIRGLRVVGDENSSSVPAPYGFTKIDVDLNMGANGDWIFLCYSRHLD